jgi:hypothetical protein
MLRAGAAAGTAAALGAAGIFAAGKASAATTAGSGNQGLPYRSPAINNQGYGEALARPQFPVPRFPGGIPDGRPAIPAPAPKGHLGNGQLRRQVAEWLAGRPGPHAVGEIAKDLRTSQRP